jgi:hypothetical protein
MVYGENLQTAVGLNHQLALGNNLQICINPLGVIAGMPDVPAAPLVTGLLGSGFGGNMQFTVGTSANFVLGQEFDINLGPTKIEISGPYRGGDPDHAASVALCALLSEGAFAFALAYGIIRDDHARAILVAVFQAAVDALLAGIMANEMALKALDKAMKDEHKLLFRKDENKMYKSLDNSNWIWSDIGVGAAYLFLLSTQLLAIGVD